MCRSVTRLILYVILIAKAGDSDSIGSGGEEGREGGERGERDIYMYIHIYRERGEID